MMMSMIFCWICMMMLQQQTPVQKAYEARTFRTKLIWHTNNNRTKPVRKKSYNVTILLS